MTAKHGESAGERAVRAVRRHEERNGHSWGVAAVVDGELHVSKGLGEIPDEYEPPEAEQVIAHTRYATRGTISPDNAHPFVIEDEEGDAVAALAHNGTWRDAPVDGDRCDSYYIAREIEEAYHETGDLEAAIQGVAPRIGETILVLAADGTTFVYSGRYEIRVDPADKSIASSGEPHSIPDQVVVKME